MSENLKNLWTTIDRRKFIILGSAAAAGGLLVGLGEIGKKSGLASQDSSGDSGASTTLNAYVHIAADNTVTILAPCPEMGQGVFTALPMLVADELEADWDSVIIKMAPTDPAYNHPGRNRQYAGGSNSVEGFYYYLRQLGAATKGVLITAAAEQWGVPAGECHARDSVVYHDSSDRSLTFGALANAASALEVQQEPTLKFDEDLTLIGKAIPRKDTPVKVDGSAIYGIDVQLPDMLVGTVKASPTFEGTVVSWDDSEARKVRGFHSIVEIPNGIAALANSYWQAKKALDATAVVFDNKKHAGVSSADIDAMLHEALDADDGHISRNDGDARAVIANASRVLEATYSVPFLAHATMEPMNCTAHVQGGKCQVWAPTQAPDRVRIRAAKVLGIALEDVEVTTTFLGGGFGRRGDVDYVNHAVLASKAAGRPVKIIWSREEDMQHDFYRPVDVTRIRAAIDESGKPEAFEATIAAPSLGAFRRPGPRSRTRTDNGNTRVFNEHPYDFANISTTHVRRKTPAPLGVWRSVSLSNNTFSLECFIDELAHELGQDPYEFRAHYLRGAPRHLGVLKLVAEKAGWGSPLPEGRARGIAVVTGFGSFAAEVAEVSIVGGLPRVHKVVAAIDCGLTVNPGIIEAQVQGSIVYALTAALRGEITLKDGAVEQSNFHDYEMVHLDEMPEVEVHIVDSTEAPGGVGEPATGPLAPAVGNAVFALTGKRIRTLPFSKHSL